MAAKKNTAVRKPWTKEDVRELKAHSKAKTPVEKVGKALKRTPGAVRVKATSLGLVWVIGASSRPSKFLGSPPLLMRMYPRPLPQRSNRELEDPCPRGRGVERSISGSRAALLAIAIRRLLAEVFLREGK